MIPRFGYDMELRGGVLPKTPEEREAEDRAKTGRWRCIGCGKFLRNNTDWNQCASCDTREYDY